MDGGGGSGGRIALYLGVNAFAGGVVAFGGGGSERGGAGTVCLAAGGDSVGDVWIGNGGAWGNVTRVSSPKPFRVHVVSNAVCYAEGALVLNRLFGTGAITANGGIGEWNSKRRWPRSIASRPS